MQPPPRGCVLKQLGCILWPPLFLQPPPRGCVLKHLVLFRLLTFPVAAASARLCVETVEVLAELSSTTGSRLRAAVC